MGTTPHLLSSIARTSRFAALSAVIAAGVLLGESSGAAAQGNPQALSNDATQILKRMTDYIKAQQNIRATLDTEVEAVTTELEKIQFTSSGRTQLSRPDKLRATRTGGYADVELVYDGRTLSLFDKHLNTYAQLEMPGTLDELIDGLRTGQGVALPFADLLLTRVYEELTADVTDAKHIGRGVINGIECEHLAFRTPEVDWQLWVELGPQPIPRKYLITSKTVVGAPQYALIVKEWRTDAPTDPNAFTFTAPPNATKVAVEALAHIDEVPAGVVAERR